jgi:glycosyltransferase involved in cell wall biosynthesis
MPAYNAARTLRQTYEELPFDIVDEVLLVDDSSSDETVTLARELNVTIFQHKRNLGYGRNQKTCYREALKRGADIVIMLHPDYQYSPKLVTSLAGTCLKFRMRKQDSQGLGFSIRRESSCFMRIIMSCTSSCCWQVADAIRR